MKQDIVSSFETEFKHAPAAFSRAPGRLEILGNHTDYNEGFVLSCATGQATEMAICMALKQLCSIDLPLPDWARVGQSVENVYLGLKSGLLDQFSSLYGKKNSFILCDFRTVEVLKTVTMPAGWKIVVANTMVKHNLVESDYNLRRESCERATKTIKTRFPEVKTLRDVSSDMLEECKSILDHTDYLRAKHVVGEDERVMKGVQLLSEGKVEEFGKLLFQSHESSRDCFENSCPELDILVELAHTIPGCVGARLSGGGFGGISIHLVRENDAEEYCKRISAAYKLKTGKTIETVICSVGDGASCEPA